MQTAIRLDPGAAIAHVRLGYVHLLRGDDRAAIEASSTAINKLGRIDTARKKRSAGYAYLNLGRAHGRLGELDQAFAKLELAKLNGVDVSMELDSDPKLEKLRGDPRFEALDE